MAQVSPLLLAGVNTQLVVRPGVNPLQLGAVVFSTEETPEQLPIGSGKQVLKTFTLPGGGRIVQDFGNSAGDVHWEGKFFGPNIGPRVYQLRSYRVSGQPQILSFKNERYLVKIEDFDPGYRGKYNAYSITCVVIQDLNGAFSVASSRSVDQQVSALQSQAQTQNLAVQNIDPTGSVAYQQSLTNLQAQIAAFTPLAQNVVAGSSPILSAVNAAVAAVGAYQATLSPTAQQQPFVTGLSASLTAIGLNVQNAQSPSTQTVTGGDLFSVAALQYGDVSQAFNLAAANGLPFPLLPSGTTLTLAIPPPQLP